MNKSEKKKLGQRSQKWKIFLHLNMKLRKITSSAWTMASASAWIADTEAIVPSRIVSTSSFTFGCVAMPLSAAASSSIWIFNASRCCANIPGWTLMIWLSFMWLMKCPWERSCRASWIDIGIGFPCSSAIWKYDTFYEIRILHKTLRDKTQMLLLLTF